MIDVHPTVARAARGELPEWACTKRKRRAHIARVAVLIGSWADASVPQEADRWRAAACLHDALRDADEEVLRDGLGKEFHEWPRPLLHGPASAQRLRAEGVTDEGLLNAISFHTVGHPALDRVGHALYMADFLEPGRKFAPEWCALMRARMPSRFDEVLREVALARIQHLMQKGSPLRPETSEFWNSLVAK